MKIKTKKSKVTIFGLTKTKPCFIKRILLYLGIPLLAWYISQNWYQLTLIQGKSMEPTYSHMQLVVLNRHNRAFTQGDVIAFRCDGLSSVLVKRVIAGPSDTAQIVDGTLFVNDQISQIYPDTGTIAYAGILTDPVTLGAGEYLVLGDNLSESKDSRYVEVGIVSEADILGKLCNSKNIA